MSSVTHEPLGISNVKVGTAPKIIAAGFLLAFLILFSMSRQTAQTSSAFRALPYGDYVVLHTVAGADSAANLGQMYDCVNHKDEACERAMLSDGRAYYVPKGTAISGQEIHDGAFSGTVTSGALVGKDIYIPVEALK